MLEELKRLRDEAEEEYIQTHSAESWADFLCYSIEAAQYEKED